MRELIFCWSGGQEGEGILLTNARYMYGTGRCTMVDLLASTGMCKRLAKLAK